MVIRFSYVPTELDDASAFMELIPDLFSQKSFVFTFRRGSIELEASSIGIIVRMVWGDKATFFL